MNHQKEILELINQYNSTDRRIIKSNLKRVMRERKFKVVDIMQLGYNLYNVQSWVNKAAPNIPLIDQSLAIAVKFDFDVKELLKIS